MQSFPLLLQKIFEGQIFIQAVFHSPRHKASHKISIRPILQKKGLLYQISSFEGTQVFHANVSSNECQNKMSAEYAAMYRQAVIHTSEGDYHLLFSKKGQVTCRESKPAKKPGRKEHNRFKHYLLGAESHLPFLVELGIMNREGKLLPGKSDKFKQINRFLEIVSDLISIFPADRSLSIVDFGCGKAYLTFALYHYLTYVKGIEVQMVGIDLKHDVIAFCRGLAKKIEYKGLSFETGDISSYSPNFSVDMVIALHACDTATDAAIEKGLLWNAKAILCAPCCQHELYRQVQNKSLEPILRHGILRERFASLATDAARAQLLEIFGYQTAVMEFIDMEHTPKNLLIRAVKGSLEVSRKTAKKKYNEFKEFLGINPTLEKLLKERME